MYEADEWLLQQNGLFLSAFVVFPVFQAEELKLLHRIARTSGILLDPTYTLKGARGLLELLHRQPDRFAGRRVVFLHTGGIHGLHDGRMLTHLQPPEDNAAESKSPGDNKPSTP